MQSDPFDEVLDHAEAIREIQREEEFPDGNEPEASLDSESLEAFLRACEKED